MDKEVLHICNGILLSHKKEQFWVSSSEVDEPTAWYTEWTKIMASNPITSWQIDGEAMETVTDFIFLGSKTTADGNYSYEIKTRLLLGRKAMTYLDSILKSRDITLLTKVCLVKAMAFPIVIYQCESWTIKKLSAEEFLVLNYGVGKESPLDCKEIKTVHPKGIQSWIFIGRTDAEAPILRPPDVKNWLIGKDPDAEKDWRQEEKGTTEDEMAGWHHWLDGHELEQAPGAGDGQGGLVCRSPWSHKELDMTEQLNWIQSEVRRKTNIIYYRIYTESRKMVLMNLFAGQQ